MNDNNQTQGITENREGNVTRMIVNPIDVGDQHTDSLAKEYGGDTIKNFSIYQERHMVTHAPITIGGRQYEFVYWGCDNQMPFYLIEMMSKSMVTAQCLAFSTKTCYGQGVRFIDRGTGKDSTDETIRSWCLANSLHETFMEQCTDMKYFYVSFTEIILSKDAESIVMMRHIDAPYVRLEYAPSTKSGRIEHIFVGDWYNRPNDYTDKEAIPLLDYYDPLGDLQVRMGKKSDPKTGLVRQPGKDRKFAIMCRMATPGCQYYPRPYYLSILEDSWLDIYRLIGLGKRYLIKNTSAPRIQIEIHDDYWDLVCEAKNITDPLEKQKCKDEEKKKIIDFATGLENVGKAMISGYYVDPNGKETHMVRFNVLNDANKKEGGNWSDDMSEASNSLCFAFGVHPNLVGATPGKSQMNNSGSDKRELFTLAQALEKPFHDVMAKPYHVLCHYNGWSNDVTVDVPMIQLTTLDENKDAKKVVNNNLNKETQP